MTRIEDLVEAIAQLQRGDLDAWIMEDLVSARRDGDVVHFTEMECARIRLICTLRYDLEIDTDTLPVVLSLVDQLYDTRRNLRRLSAAVAAQDEAVRAAVVEAMAGGDESPEDTESEG
jgi:chaperone modulatory protein CbpM